MSCFRPSLLRRGRGPWERGPVPVAPVRPPTWTPPPDPGTADGVGPYALAPLDGSPAGHSCRAVARFAGYARG